MNQYLQNATESKRRRTRASGTYFSASLAAIAVATGVSMLVSGTFLTAHRHPHPTADAVHALPEKAPDKGAHAAGAIAPFMEQGIKWLVAAQNEDGGWGAGSYDRQGVRDPHAVVTDPGTTALTAMALLRAGYNPLKGEHHETLRKALDYLLDLVENYKGDGPRISDITGTQPQRKLGEFVDVSLCAQFFGRALPLVADNKKLSKRVTAALDKCLGKIQASQKEDGSWNYGGWAPVLQSSMANNALEVGKIVGRDVDDEVLNRSREYQKSNYQAATKSVRADAGAGIELYANSSGQRASANEAKQAIDLVEQAKQEGKLDRKAAITYDALVKAGASKKDADNWSRAYDQYRAAADKLEDEQMLAGFGNNGGEEFLSYMLTSESMVVTGGKEWEEWNARMHTRLAKIQNSDGSWSGHHCITSPVFCTAAAILCLTADRDLHTLQNEQADGARGASMR